MKTNQYRDDWEPFSVLYSANDTVERTDQESSLIAQGTIAFSELPIHQAACCSTHRRPQTISAPHTDGLFHNLAHRYAGHDFRSD